MGDSSNQAKEIFLAALENHTPEQWPTFLQQACGGDAVLRTEVEKLLQARAALGSFHEAAHSLPSATADEPIREKPGTIIGPYKLLEEIGEGGFGIVFMAEQQQPLRRMVALKVLKPGMDTRQIVARFEAERQALALMEHPHIARVFDGGETVTGRPYFVMELVRGVPIGEFCDRNHLPIRERLELFLDVCQAVQHAHQKGVIHRDLKPSNVLVTLHDDKAVVKVIDFGIAKAIGQQLTDKTLFTGFAQMIGTPLYMSPEQAQMSSLDVDTRSDIYSLGVLLYELLTGTTPFDRERLRTVGYDEMRRIIREEEPPRPSLRISTLGQAAATVSSERRSNPKRLSQLLRGELDWIVMKALEKDRNRRYGTVSAFAMDVRRYLNGEPVQAHPPSRSYRLRKLAWRHRRGLVIAAALLLLLVTGTIASSALALWALRAEADARRAAHQAEQDRDKAVQAEARATEQRDRAERARRATGKERDRAVKAEEDATAVLDYFREHVLSAGRPEGLPGGLGRDVTLYKAVDTAEPAIAAQFQDRPRVEAAIRNTLGLTYGYLGDLDRAIHQLKRALALREKELGPDHMDTLNSRNNLAIAYDTAGRPAEAIRLHEQTLKHSESKFGPGHPNTLVARNNLASAYDSAGRTADVIRLLEPNLKQCESQLGPTHADTLQCRNNLAGAYRYAGRTAEAIRLFEQTLRQCVAHLSPDHPLTNVTRNNLASIYYSVGRYAEAIPLLEQSAHQSEAQLGSKHPTTLQIRSNLGANYRRVGRGGEALRLLERTLKQQEIKPGLDHPTTLVTMGNLGLTYRDAGRIPDALALLEKAWQRGRQQRGDLPPHVAWLASALADTYDCAGQFVKSEALYRDFLERARRRFGPKHEMTAVQMAALGLNLRRQKKYAEAESLLREALALRQSKQPDAWTTFNTQVILGAVLLGQEKYADAAPLLLKGYRGMKQREAKIPLQVKGHLTEALELLAQLYEATGQKAEAEKWRKELSAAKASRKK